MLTLEQLVRLTPAKLHRKLRSYHLASLKADTTSKGPRLIAVVVGGSRPAQPALEQTAETWDMQAPTKVQCNCNYFIHNCEVALTARGSAGLARSNGAYPRKRNPQLMPGLCPHLLLLAKIVASKSKERRRSAHVRINPALKDL